MVTLSPVNGDGYDTSASSSFLFCVSPQILYFFPARGKSSRRDLAFVSYGDELWSMIILVENGKFTDSTPIRGDDKFFQLRIFIEVIDYSS